MKPHHIELQDGGVAEVFVAGDGPAIVLLPSLGRAHDDFGPLIQELVPLGLRVLCPQPRGLNEALPAREGDTLHDLADDITGVLTALGIERAVVAGHAFGNWVARAFATRHPERTRGVVLLAPAPEGPIDRLLAAGIDVCLDPDVDDEARRRALENVFFAPGNDASVWSGGWHRLLAQHQRRARAHTQPGWQSAGTAPVLSVQAAQDAFLSGVPDQSMRQHLGARMRIAVIEGAGHALIPEQPRAVAEAVSDFMNSLG